MRFKGHRAVTLHIPPEMHDRAVKEARQDGITFSKFVSRALRNLFRSIDRNTSRKQ